MDRAFTQKQKRATALAQGISKPLDEMQADHIRPWSKGGRTDMENCQILSPEANRAKSGNYFIPRAWQKRFFQKYEAKTARDFLLVAIPGAGKTWAALKVVNDWMGRTEDDRRVLIVVPTDHLREHWQGEASRHFGIELQTKEFGTNFKEGYRGAVVTYQTVISNTLLFRKLSTLTPTTIIFDEIHHCATDKTWGGAVREAFSDTHASNIYRLSMSGTPFRTDCTAIPFFSYDGRGFCVPDIAYDYPDALRDGVIRYLHFEGAKGEATISKRDEEMHLEMNAEISDDAAANALQHILNPEGEWVSSQIRAAHAKLTDLRRSVPDAGGIVMAKDIYHATSIAKIIRKETGCDPAVIVSDDSVANSSVKEFDKSTREWLVSVRQVSEGADIKRLQVLVYLTTYATEVFFRQAVGRISRMRGLQDATGCQLDGEGYIFMPSDPRLLRFAENIKEAQCLALQEKVDIAAERELITDPAIIEFLGSTPSEVEVEIIDGKRWEAEEARKIAAVASYAGTTNTIAAKCYEGFMANVNDSSIDDARQPPEKCKEEREKELRTRITSMMNRLHFKYRVGESIKALHREFNIGASGKYVEQSQMTEAELEMKLVRVLKEIQSCQSL